MEAESHVATIIDGSRIECCCGWVGPAENLFSHIDRPTVEDLHQRGLTPRLIAARRGTSTQAVYKRLAELGLPIRSR